MRLYIIFNLVCFLLIGSGIFIASNGLNPSSYRSDPVTVSSAVEATNPSTLIEESKKKEPTSKTKGTISYETQNNFQATTKSKVTTKKLPEVKQTIEKPNEQTPPNISEPSSNEKLPFSDVHFESAVNLIDAITDADSQLDSIYLKLLLLEVEYNDLPKVVAIKTSGQGLERYNLVLASEQDRVISEYNQLVGQYNLIEYDRDTWYSQLCSTYYDVLFYFGYESYCN